MPAPIETWAEAAVTVPAARRSRAKSALRVVFISHLVDCIPRGVGLPRSVVSARGHSFIGQEPCQVVSLGGRGEGPRERTVGGREGTGDFPPLCPLGRPTLRSLTLGPSPLRGEGGPGDQPR